MRVIALSNQKGGVGKTTVGINLAGALNDLGDDVLFIDLDPQGNATEGLGHADAYEATGSTLYDVLVDGAPLADLIVEHPEMDVVPSNIEMFNAESELTTAMRGRQRLQTALEEFDGDAYDYCIVDCPPQLGVLTDSALIASDDLVIPGLAESTSKRAVEILFDQLDTLRDHYGGAADERAVVANRVEPDGECKETMEWFRDVFEPAIPVYEIRKRVALKRAWNEGVSIYAHDEECDMTAVFTDLAETVSGRVKA